jgi:hypothetical protein
MNASVRIRELKRDKCNFILGGVNLGCVLAITQPHQQLSD